MNSDEQDDSAPAATPGRAALVNFSGPYGVGKDSLLARVASELGDRAWRVRTVTTRPVPEGFDPSYSHVDSHDFARLTAEGRWIVTTQIGGAIQYGTSLDEIDSVIAHGHVALHSVYAGPQGAGQLRRAFGPRLFSIGLLATRGDDVAEIAELTQRLRARGRDDAITIERRLPNQREKVAYVRTNPLVETASGQMPAFDIVVVNDDLDRAADEVRESLRKARVLQERTHAV